jgi:hypothetical protein
MPSIPVDKFTTEMQHFRAVPARCPFCGNVKCFEVILFFGKKRVHCTTCDALGPSKDLETEAILAWGDITEDE